MYSLTPSSRAPAEKRGPWAPAAEPPPAYAFTIQALMPDGATCPAIWTGASWWWGGAELHPVGWRWVRDFTLSCGSGG